LKAGNQIKSQRGGGGGVGNHKIQIAEYCSPHENLHKYFAKADLPWVQLIWAKYYPNGKLPRQVIKGSFWWSILRLLDTCKGIS
jgi:hypothetical protein